MGARTTNVTRTKSRWHGKRTEESNSVEQLLREAGFEQVDAYRYNSASIRVRVVDSRFEKLSISKRHTMLNKHLSRLPEETERDIVSLLLLSPSELADPEKNDGVGQENAEFERPSPSRL